MVGSRLPLVGKFSLVKCSHLNRNPCSLEFHIRANNFPYTNFTMLKTMDLICSQNEAEILLMCADVANGWSRRFIIMVSKWLLCFIHHYIMTTDTGPFLFMKFFNKTAPDLLLLSIFLFLFFFAEESIWSRISQKCC